MQARIFGKLNVLWAVTNVEDIFRPWHYAAKSVWSCFFRLLRGGQTSESNDPAQSIVTEFLHFYENE